MQRRLKGEKYIEPWKYVYKRLLRKKLAPHPLDSSIKEFCCLETT